MKYSVFKIISEALSSNNGWEHTWKKSKLKPTYDIVIVGGGGHGIATAYYLAKNFNLSKIAVIEKGWIGSGNVGRNTTIIRSNYLLKQNQPFYEFSLKLWENLEQELNYNAMVSQRGIMNIFHNDPQRDAFVRRGNSMKLSGAGAELLSKEEVKKAAPFLDFENARFPIKGALCQTRGGTVRHDAVAWGYARAASKLGVDIIENCEVKKVLVEKNCCVGVETDKGIVKSKKTAVCVSGSSSLVMSTAGIKLPIESHVLQAFVTEAIKPLIPGVITFGAGHFYVSQSDKGSLVFGGDLDGYNSYAQRGNLPTIEDVCEGGMAIMPMIGRAKLVRIWGGIMDMSMDGSPFIDKTPLENLYFNGGWCYGGFKATPASGFCYAHLIAKNEPHILAKEYKLDRFKRGTIIDEKGQGAQPNLH